MPRVLVRQNPAEGEPCLLAFRERRLVIVVGASGAADHRWRRALAELEPEIVASLADSAPTSDDDIVVFDFPKVDEAVIEAQRATISAARGLRILTAEHEELPVIVRSRIAELCRHIVPRRGSAANVRRLLRRLRGPNEVGGTTHDAGPTKGHHATSWGEAVALLAWTIRHAVRVPGVIVRSYRPLANKLEVQLVFRLGRGFERFHCKLPRRWGWPLRWRSGERFSRVDRAHASVQDFGELERDQEIFVRATEHSGDCAYVAVLPWNRDDRVTVAIGIWLDDVEADRRKARERAVADLHSRAVCGVSELALPALDETEGGVRYLLEYDWVVTKDHVGPDRRRDDTSFVNRYMFFGRRAKIAANIAVRTGAFSDRIPSWVGRYFIAYAVLAVFDTCCTSRFVSAGRVVEANPLLAPLLAHCSWSFLVVKNVLALTAFAVAVRFHHFPRARYSLAGSVVLYAVLGLYWVMMLVATRH